VTVYVLLSYFCVFPESMASTLFLKSAEVFDENPALFIDQFATDIPIVFVNKDNYLSAYIETKAYTIGPIANIPWSDGFSGVNFARST